MAGWAFDSSHMVGQIFKQVIQDTGPPLLGGSSLEMPNTITQKLSLREIQNSRQLRSGFARCAVYERLFLSQSFRTEEGSTYHTICIDIAKGSIYCSSVTSWPILASAIDWLHSRGYCGWPWLHWNTFPPFHTSLKPPRRRPWKGEPYFDVGVTLFPHGKLCFTGLVIYVTDTDRSF